MSIADTARPHAPRMTSRHLHSAVVRPASPRAMDVMGAHASRSGAPGSRPRWPRSATISRVRMKHRANLLPHVEAFAAPSPRGLGTLAAVARECAFACTQPVIRASRRHLAPPKDRHHEARHHRNRIVRRITRTLRCLDRSRSRLRRHAVVKNSSVKDRRSRDRMPRPRHARSAASSSPTCAIAHVRLLQALEDDLPASRPVRHHRARRAGWAGWPDALARRRAPTTIGRVAAPVVKPDAILVQSTPLLSRRSRSGQLG